MREKLLRPSEGEEHVEEGEEGEEEAEEDEK